MLKAPHKMGLIFFPAFDWAIAPDHPEREERLLYTMDQLKEEGVFDIPGIEEFKPDVARDIDVARTHFTYPDIATVTTESHMISAGGAIKAARLVCDGVVDRAFALVRPPGHHAMKSVVGNRGFCNINNEAIMIEYIREHYPHRRIAIVDTDCHHGDGTQDIYWNDPNVLFISIHQDGRTLYPGTGAAAELGGPNARGRTINIPLPPETGEEGFLKVIDDIVMPILEDFKPELIINSAGQDNHYTDPITNMNFTAQGYAILNEKISPHIAVLEGGYSIKGALPYVNLGIVLAMAGIDYSMVREPDYDTRRPHQDGSINDYIDSIAEDIKNIYFDPPGIRNLVYPGDWIERPKDIFYDTDGFREQQHEWVMYCNDCSGVVKLESHSPFTGLNMGIEIPVDACDNCYNEGLREINRIASSGRYNQVQVINRRDRE
jgi:acetoin utilization deacetylase AcuC-like enzyme